MQPAPVRLGYPRRHWPAPLRRVAQARLRCRRPTPARGRRRPRRRRLRPRVPPRRAMRGPRQRQRDDDRTTHDPRRSVNFVCVLRSEAVPGQVILASAGARESEGHAACCGRACTARGVVRARPRTIEPDRARARAPPVPRSEHACMVCVPCGPRIGGHSTPGAVGAWPPALRAGANLPGFSLRMSSRAVT